MSLPAELRKALKEGKVIPFVGAGISMSVTRQGTGERLFPSWKELLERAAGQLKGVDDSASGIVAGLLDKSRYLEAATEAHRFLGGSRWPDFLREQFQAKRSDADPNSLSLAQSVWRLGSTLVITTNYDNVVRWAHDQSDDVAQWKTIAVAEQAQSLREMPKNPTLWHLHGHIDDIKNIVLTEESYKRLYEVSTNGESEHAAAREALKFHLTSKSFLFIGYSLDDDPFVQQLQYLHRLFGGSSSPHFALLRKGELDRFEAKKLGVTPVCYTGHGPPLLDLMSELAECCKKGNCLGAETAISGSNNTGSSPEIPKVADFSPTKPAWNIPYGKKGDKVVGREEALDRVRKQLVEGKRTNIGQTAAFQGLGGLGKTQMAIEYAWEYRAAYPAGVIWINADQDLDPQLSAVAIKSEWVSPQSDSKTVFDIARQRMRNFDGGLIIFDNLEDKGAIQEYLPDSSVDVHILVTSRGELPGFISIKIALLNPEQAEMMLVQESERFPQTDAEKEALRRVVEVLDGLPLALELVGAYMARRESISWVQYAALLEESLRDTLDLAARLHDGGFTKHETDLFATLRLSEALIKDIPLLQEVLRLLAWSGTAAMGIDLVRAMLGESSVHNLLEALGVGVSLSILKAEGENRYALHRLIRHVQREEFRVKEHESWAREKAVRLGDWFENHRKDVMELSLFEAEIDHLETWLREIDGQDPGQESRLRWLQAYPPYHRGQYNQSRIWLEQAFARLAESTNSDEALYANILSDLGTIATGLGNYSKALECKIGALEIRRKVFGERHPDTANSLRSVGVSYGNLDNHKEALEYKLCALEIHHDVLAARHPDTASSLDSVGVTYGNLGKHTEALEYNKKALEIRREVFGARHPQTAESMENVGIAYGNLDNHKEALEFKMAALQVRRDILGARHPFTAISLNSVGISYDNLGEHAEALEYKTGALEIRREVLGARHPQTADSLERVGVSYGNLGNHTEALEHYLTALEIRREVFGARHPDIPMSLNLIGTSCFSLKRFKEAARYQLEASELAFKLHGPHHKDTIMYSQNCALAYARLGIGKTKGLPLLRRVLKDLPSDNPQYKELRTLRDDIKKGKIKKYRP